MYKKRILFVMNTMGRAGAEKALVEFLRILDRERYQVSLYVLIPRGEMFRQLPDHVKVWNARPDERSVLSLGGKWYIGKQIVRAAFRKGCLKKAVKRLRKVRKETGADVREKSQMREKILRRMLADGKPAITENFDLAVAYLEGPATWYTAEKISAKKKVAFLHVDYQQAGYSNVLDEGCYEQFDRIFAVSSEVKKQFLKVYPQYENKTALFYNIINRERICRNAEKTGGFTDGYTGFRILTVGRLYHQKGFDLAVETAELLIKAGCSFRWYVLGEGEEKSNIQNLIRRKHLEQIFILLGAVDNPYPYFKQADLYVCTSRYEGKSISIEEAQVLGKPVAAFRCTGIEEQIRNGIDGIITDQDPQQMAGEIQKLMKNEQILRQLGNGACKKERAGKEGLELFTELLRE